ncbi:hypothetical protein GCM10011614_07370 [Novosphingobium colocasiae]|uniref:Type ISP restriction-modification enzyme LLaBIII C-terminal specificity domain-containing protein n=1 Tax=Novosphingobium colocasiae TaxID=1256513 RepID=A0A918UD80_9SPHN|nr:hypothetical protein GCM10011614_07370 [Novosphingobium colocasiae]
MTARDELTIDMDRGALWLRVQDFTKLAAEALRDKYKLGEDARDWTVEGAKADVTVNFGQNYLMPIAYRPFDTRWTYYTGNSRGFLCYPREEVMRHLADHENISMMLPKQTKDGLGALVCAHIAGHKAFSGFDITSNLPLYLYPHPNYPRYTDTGHLDESIHVNFDLELYAQIRKAAGLTSPLTKPDGTDTFRKATGNARPDEVKVFDYIYGVLHSPAYRARYAEFLKIGFPRIPFPASPESFRAISEKGEALRRLHLMEDAAIGATPYPFHGDGDSVLDKPRHENGQVWINADQYFDGVPAIAWDFHIGGYQPAQKWLKDRKGRALTYDDIRHYQRIIKILAETDRIMRTIEVPLD